ncbi:MAG: glucosylceramidase, partial [Ferruginibacter sp.]
MACSKSGNNNSGGGGATPPDPTPSGPGISYWLSSGDKSNLLRAGVTAKNFGSTSNSLTNITVDSTQQFQAIDGFGYTFTE